MNFNLEFLDPYIELAPYLGAAFLFALLVTPLIGHFAKKFGFVDLPAQKRHRLDKTKDQRIHKNVIPRAGGLAVIIPFAVALLFTVDLNMQMLSLFIGLFILTVSGIFDDKYELSGRSQLLLQFLAALIVVVGGTTIPSIQVLGQSFDFALFTKTIEIGTYMYHFIFPADLITIFWILTIINAINWVYGIDGLGESMTFIAALTTMLITVKLGYLGIAVLPGVLAFSTLGFLPYNFPPAKIFSGTAGSTGYGFLLASLSIITGAKVSNALIILAIPLLDMIYVIFYRLITLKDLPFYKRPFQSGRIHLHHRLMDLGFNNKETLLIEVTTGAIVSTIAFYLAGFGTKLLSAVILVTTLAVISSTVLFLNRRKKKKAKETASDTPPPPIEEEVTPEERYAY